MKNIIVIETPRWRHFPIIIYYLLMKMDIAVLEPFYSFHKKNNKYRFFPALFPKYINKFIETGRIKLISAKEINSRDIYLIAVEKAVQNVEYEFEKYNKRHALAINYAKKRYSDEITTAFKKVLCERLAEAYSQKITIDRVCAVFKDRKVHYYADLNIYHLLKYEFTDSLVYYPAINSIIGLLEIFIQNLKAYAVCVIWVFYAYFSFRKTRNLKEKYKYAVSVISPMRQLANNRRTPLFFVDNLEIRNSEVLVVILNNVKMGGGERNNLESLGCDWIKTEDTMKGNPGLGNECLKAMLFYLKTELFSDEYVFKTFFEIVHEYNCWDDILKRVNIDNFITHSDVMIRHIPRNIKFKERGTKTWHYTDSINGPLNFENKVYKNIRHPFWTYLRYDNFVTWTAAMQKYFKAHPGGDSKCYVIGCLWSSLIKKTENHEFTIAVFDTTYSINGITDVEEGLAFLDDIYMLAKELQKVKIVFKIKKDKIFINSMGEEGAKLFKKYNESKQYPNITFVDHGEDAEEIMSESSFVISFPFTSTTIESLSVGIPSVWHDPMGYYKDTVFALNSNTVTHSYKELASKIKECISSKEKKYNLKISNNDYFDPYNDSKAIERFIELLAGENT